MKKVLILEDNLATLKHLSCIVEEIDIKSKIYAFENVKEAYQCVLERRIDLFIIDIILDTSSPGDSSGLKFVESIRRMEQYAFTPVIFVTSLEDAKLFTYEKLHCYSFIEKPFSNDEVKENIRNCLRFPDTMNELKTMYFRKDGVILAVEQRDIVYIESNCHNLYIHTRKKDVLSVPYITIKKFLSDAENPYMIQCSRNSIFNKEYVHSIDFANGIIRMKDGLGQVNIGIRYKGLIKEIFR